MSSQVNPIVVDLSMSDDMDGDDPEFDLDEAVRKLVGPVIAERGEPDFVPRKAAVLKQSIREVAKNLRRGNENEVTRDDMDNVKLWIYGAFALEEMTPEINQLFNVRGVLDLIGDPTANFPKEFQAIAQGLTHNFESQWRKPSEPETPRKKRQKLEKSPYFTTSRPAKSTALGVKEPGVYVKAHPTHPIFGEAGIMRHVLVGKGASVSYRVDPLFKIDCKIFGHNKLAVGQWWPMVVAAFRDGAHGHRMAGISGSADEGCYSVIVAGAYSDVDVDSGNEVLYSAPKSHDTRDPEPDLSNHGTKVLLRSADTRKPIRVLRQSTGHWEGRPRVGLRYDGLYMIHEYTRKKNGHGGGFIQFRLKRCSNQPPIDRSRPTQEEKELFRRVKDRF